MPDAFDAIRFTDLGGVQNINTNAMPKVKLSLTDTQGNPLTAVASLQVTNGLVEPGHFENDYQDVTINGQDTIVQRQVFKQDNSVVIENGEVELYIFPLMRSGEDELRITIPGRDPIIVPITINPGSPRVVEANTQNNLLKIDDTSTVAITVTDIWGNLVPGSTDIEIRTLGSIDFGGSQVIQATNGQASIQVSGVDPGGRGFLTALVEGIPFNRQRPGLQSFVVQNTFIPTENLNVMYMNLFGTDWANFWGYFSENKAVASEMINESPKMLSVTTQLTDPTKLNKFVATVNTKAVVQSDDLANQSLVVASNKLFLQHAVQNYQISLGDISDYTLIQKQTLA